MKQKSIGFFMVGLLLAVVLVGCGDSVSEPESKVAETTDVESSVAEQTTNEQSDDTTSSVHSIADSSDAYFDEEGNMISQGETEEESAAQQQITFLETVIADEGRTTERPLFTPVALKVGQKIASPTLPGGLTVLFAEVLEDSRCPIGSDCPVPGKMVIRTELASNVTPLGELVMTIEEGQDGPTVKKVSKYSAVFISLEPHPVEGETIDPSEYVAVIAVIK